MPSMSLHRVTTRTLIALDVCFVWKLAPLSGRNGFFHRISIATIDAIEHVFNVANSYLAVCLTQWKLYFMFCNQGIILYLFYLILNWNYFILFNDASSRCAMFELDLSSWHVILLYFWWKSTTIIIISILLFTYCICAYYRSLKQLRLHTYISLTLHPWRGSRGISDIPPRCRRFTKIANLWGILQTWQVVSQSPYDRSLSQA
jgi:hypothetical protein